MTSLIINTITTIFVACAPAGDMPHEFSFIEHPFVEEFASARSWAPNVDGWLKQRNKIIKENSCVSNLNDKGWAREWLEVYLQKPDIKSECSQKPSNRLLNIWYQHIKKALKSSVSDKVNKIQL